MIPKPGQSIYMWMYRQGLQQRPIEDVVMDCILEGHDIRNKDMRNYWNGWYRHDLYFKHGGDACHPDEGIAGMPERLAAYTALDWEDYPEHPYLGKPEVQNCFVPCNGDNRPMVKWGRGTMTLADARAWPGCVYLAENMKGAQRIVIDVDGDHGGGLDIETIEFFSRWMDLTCCHSKPELVADWYLEHEGYIHMNLHTAELPVSYHLTFGVDRVVPTMHFPAAHVDVIGNRRNSLRYFKNKVYNGLPPLRMTGEIWDEVMDFIERRGR